MNTRTPEMLPPTQSRSWDQLTFRERVAHRPRVYFGKAILLIIMTFFAILFALPFLWMVSTSVKAPTEVWTMPPQFLPSSVQWNNYVEPWGLLQFGVYYRNTVTIVVFSMIGTLLSCSLVAFGFARLRFPLRNFWFVVLLATMMLPGHVTMIPVYLGYSVLGWVNTLLPLIVPSFFGGAFSIFLLRQFMMTIPTELDDAARIDGAGFLGIYSWIMLPLIRPALGVVAIFTFTDRWSDFMGPLIYLNSPKWFTISLGLRLINSVGDTYIQYTMAMTIVSLIPVLLVFFLAQRYFIQGIVVSGIKG